MIRRWLQRLTVWRLARVSAQDRRDTQARLLAAHLYEATHTSALK
jgi:hypothetical protein